MSARTAEPPAAVVMCGGGLGAYDIVRTLGLAGIRSAVFVSQRDDPALHSRYVQESHRLPEFREWNFRKILDLLGDYGAARRDRPVLFHAGDSETLFLSRFRDALLRWFRFALPPRGILEAVSNKARFVDLARRAGLPIPQSRVFASAAQLESGVGAIELPCIVKPAYNQDWFWESEALRARFGGYRDALRRFDRVDALREFCAALPHRSSGFIVQSYIDGRDERLASFHAYLDERSRCLGYFLTRVIRTNPPHTGDATCSETFHDEALARVSRECLARVGYRGIVKIDYKWDERARQYRLLEIEPHYQAAHPLGAHAGVNLARIAFRHARGESVEEEARYDSGIRLLELRQDLKAYWRGYRKTREWTGRSYLQSLLGRTHFRLFEPRDPGPFLVAGIEYLRRKLRLAPQAGQRDPLVSR